MIVNGTTYNSETPQKVVDVLERARARGTRLRLVLGDAETGESWHATHMVTGTVGRSMGPMKVPLMIASPRSLGGPAILDHCVIGVRHANRKNGGWLYRHPKYKGNE